MSLDRVGLLQFGSDTSCSPSSVLDRPASPAKGKGKGGRTVFRWVSIDEIIPVFQDLAEIEMMEL